MGCVFGRNEERDQQYNLASALSKLFKQVQRFLDKRTAVVRKEGEGRSLNHRGKLWAKQVKFQNFSGTLNLRILLAPINP